MTSPDDPHHQDDVHRDRERPRARVPSRSRRCVGPQGGDAARTDPGHQPGHRVRRRSPTTGIPTSEREAHRLDDGPGRPRVLREEREHDEDERESVRARRRSHGPAGGASALSEATDDEPGEDRPVGGHQHKRRDRDRAPLLPRRRAGRLRPGGGSRRPRHRAQPLTAPAVSPRTKYFWRAKNTISGSAIEMNAAAVSRCQFSPVAPTRFARARS